MGAFGPKRNCAWAIIFCVLLCRGFVNAGTSCKTGCPKSESGFLQYATGSVYEYTFDSLLTVGVSAGGAGDNDDSSLKIVGAAKVFAEGNCGYTLQLGAVKVSATKEGTIEKRLAQTITKPVRFTLVDGYLEPEICADSAEDTYALNVKRAIVSLLQSAKDVESRSEYDVFGQCPTHTAVSKAGSGELVTKLRDLNSCAYREQIVSGIINGVVNEAAGVKASLLLQANYVKESKIERGIVQEVHLAEDYHFLGKQQQSADVKAKVVTNLKLKNVGKAPAPAVGGNASPASIIFQKPDVYATKNIAALKSVVSKILETSSDYVQKDSAKKFVELIRLMRNSDADTLLELASVPFPNKVLARKVYLDALFRTGTDEAAKAIIKQFGKLNDKEKVLAMLSLNLVQVVDRETINQAAALITPAAAKEVYLAVGHLVAKYCQQHNCESVPEIDGISKRFTDALKHCKANTKKEEERILYVLKGIGNTHHIAKSAAGPLTECTGAGRSMRLRVAALQASGAAASCENAVRQTALQLLRDHNEDSELRIEAYLAAVQCPTAQLANEIAEIVNNEPVYQVGGFIASHLRALRDSTDKSRAEQRHFLGNVRVTKNFPHDFRRYSHNHEVSYGLDALGVSASADYKLIYSQHGFLPRSGRLNVSSEVFGINFNVFEASVRQDNLENILEYYLGPKGLLNKDFDEIIKASGAGGGRSRRSIADDSTKFSKKYKTYGANNKNLNDLNLDLTLKLFGSEMLFLSLGDYIPNTLDDIIRTFSMAFDTFKKEVSSFQKDFNMHSLFLDTELIYPTSLGMPLELSAQGLAANKFSLALNVDVDAILEQNWQRAKYRLKIVPSVDVNLDLRVGFNAYVLSTGLRVSSSLQSATGADVNLAFINENGFTVDVQLPREKLELVNVQISSDFYIAEGDKDIKLIQPKANKKSKSDDNEMCFDQLKSMGFTFCFYQHALVGDKSDQQAGSAINWLQPYSAGLSVISELNYHLKGYHVPQTPQGSKQWKLDFSTPGSQESHDTSLAFELGVKPRAFGRLSLDLPQYHFALEAGLQNDDREMVLYAQYEQNNEVTKNKVGFEKHGNEYRPIIAIQGKNGETVKDINGYRADGRVLVQKTGENEMRYNFENFQIINNKNERLTINGWAEVGPTKLKTELHVAPGQQSYLVKNHVEISNGAYHIGTFVNNEKTPDNVFGAAVDVTLQESSVELELIGKALGWELATKNNVQYVKAEGLKVPSSTKFNSEVSLKQKQQLVGSLSVDGFTEAPKNFGLNAKLVRGKNAASLGIKYKAQQQATNDFLLEVNGKLNKHFVDLMLKCDVSGNNFVVDNVLTTSWGTAVTVKGKLGQRYTLQDILIDLNGSAQLSSKDKPSLWVLKVLGVPEKTTAEFSLKRENQELIKITGETQHPQDKISGGKLNLLVKNILSSKADFKIAKNGKGDLNANVEILRTEPKHKIDFNAKFNIQAPKYDVETTITLDADKKLYFKTENQIEKQKFSTKNLVEFNEKKLTFDANAQVKGADWRTNGELVSSFVLNSPTGHIFDGSINRKITTNAKSGQAQGSMDLQLNEQFGGKKQSLIWKSKLDRLNLKSKDIAVTSQVSYVNGEGKNLNIDYHIKHLPTKAGSQQYSIDFGVKAVGTIEGVKPIDVTLVVQDYDAKHAVFQFNGNYANGFVGSVNGDYHLTDSVTAPTTFAVQANLQNKLTAPPQSYDFKANGKYLRPGEGSEGLGAHQLELHVSEQSQSGQFFKLNTVVNTARKQGSYNLDVETEGMQGAFKIEGNYQRSIDEQRESGKQQYSSSISYGQKYLKSSVDFTYAGHAIDSLTLHYNLDSSFESAKNVVLNLQTQKLDADSHKANAEFKLNNQVYNVDTRFYRGMQKKGLDIKIKTPQQAHPISIVGIFEILGERKAKLNAEVANLGDLDFKVDAESAFKDIDNFYITAQWNSVRLNLLNYDLEFKSQQKNIHLKLQNAAGVIVDGSATYVLKKEKSKSIIEGQGQVQYKGQKQNTNFKIIRQVYDAVNDKEIGFSYTFNGNFGPKNGVSTFKLTNKDFNVKLSVCEEKKQCTNVQLQSQLTTDESAPFESIQHSLLALIDLRELGYPYEFEFQSKTIRQGFKIQYSLDSNIISNNNLKYQFIVNVLPTTSKIQLKLPSREILLETQSQYPEKGLFGKYSHAAAFYFDKTRKPNDVARLISTFDITGIESGLAALNARGEIRFEHPQLRPLSINGKADFNRQEQTASAELNLDIFRVPEQQLLLLTRIQNVKQAGRGFNITTNQQVRSKGLGIQYEVNAHTALDAERQEFTSGAELIASAFDAKLNAWIQSSKDHLEASVDAFNEPLLSVVGDFNRQKYVAAFKSKLHLFGQQPLEVNSDLQPSFAKVQIKRQGLTDANLEIKLGKELKFQVTGADKPLINARVALDPANFLQTQYNSNEENLQNYMQTVEGAVKKETDASIEKIKQRLQKLRQHIEHQIQLSKDSVPDFTQFKQNLEQSLTEISNELQQDPALKHIAESYREIFNKLTKIAQEISKSWVEAYEQIHKSVLAVYEKLQVIVAETVIPAWEEFLTATTKIVGELRIEVINFYSEAMKIILGALEKYGPMLRNYGKAVNEALKPYAETMQELYKVIVQAVEEISDEFRDYIAKLPTFDAFRAEFKDKLEKLKIAEHLLEIVNTAFEQLDILPVTPEIYALFEKIHVYLQNKLKGQEVNDAEVFEELFKLLLRAIRSVMSTIQLSLPLNVAGVTSDGLRSMLTTSLPNSLDFVSGWPMGLLSFRFSLINFVLNEDWSALLKRDYLQTWSYLHDFGLKAHIADGQHIFTFDGQYYAFRGNCKYILAQDSVDGNFTLVGQLNNGKLKSLVLTDRDGNYLEVNDAGALKLNGNPAEYPVHETGSMHAWRKYYTIWLLSEYGVKVMCTTDLKVCHLDVNGFYTSKTRGLFGNGNFEPYDDYLKVDGTISERSSAFGNDYGLGKCNPVPEESSSNVPHADICNEIFGLDSPLASWYLLVDSRPYRQACDLAVQSAAEKDKETAACNLALAYGSAIALDHQYSVLPQRCLKCPGAAGQRDLYQEFTVKVPTNKADVVFVVDVGVEPSVLANLVAPAITEIRETLKTRGFTDVQVGVIAFNESQSYPALLTSDNGKLNYNGNLAAVQLNGPKNFCDNCISQIVTEKYILEAYEIIERIVKSIVPQPDELAFEMALNYPYRAGAAKTIIGVRSDSLEYGNVMKWVRAHISEAVTQFDGAILHMIAPVQGMALEGVAAEKLIGFNSRLVATLDGKDAKKRQKLEFETDMGIDFVLNSGGWVFGTQNFDKLKPADQKKALNQVTNSIADTLFKTEIVADCKCLPVHGLHAQHHCTVKSSNFVPNKKVKAK